MKIHEIKEAIQVNIDDEKSSVNVFEHLITVFTPFEGKPISKRMETALNKNLPAGYWRAYLNRIAGLIQMVIVPDNFENRITFLLAYNTKPTYFKGTTLERHSGFAYYNNCHGEAARIRNQKRRELLSKAIKLAGIANTYAQAKKVADDAKAELNELAGFDLDIEMAKVLGMHEK